MNSPRITAMAMGALLALAAAAAADVWRYDLDRAESVHTEAGWTSVPRPDGGSGTMSQYTAAAGYGWLAADGIKARDRGSGGDLGRDFHFAPDRLTFLVDVPNAAYDVTLYFRDSGYAHDRIDAWAEGTQFVDDLASGTSTMVTRTFEVSVSDGQLTLEIADDGGSDPNWVLSGIEVVPVPEPGTLALLGIGLAGALLRRRRRRS